MYGESTFNANLMSNDLKLNDINNGSQVDDNFSMIVQPFQSQQFNDNLSNRSYGKMS